MEKIIAKDGTEIHYLRLGEGSPVLFLHGWSASAKDWLPFAAELADDHDVICWDARGHGGHHLPAGTATDVQTMAADLQQLIEHHDLQNLTLVGHSMGALTLWQYIRDFGCDRLAGIGIIDQSPKLVTDEHWANGIYGHFDAQANQQLIKLLREDFAEGLLQLVANGYNQKSYENYSRNSRGFQQMREHLQRLEAEPLVQCWESLTAADYRDVLPQISVPALLIYGDESQFYAKPVAEYVRDHIPQAELHIYEKADHSPQLWHRERFIWDIKQFIRQLKMA
ncbi:alpha/beta hydrolase [Amphritea sp. 2_MG-2023]|jgi:pimeloyl-ACP methyl ester carboxylesterase|uniref:alpha/beta fold hydrolase n=1 Tax=Amphritea TaxID=515417 RepID=UPI001C07813D|nr:MULTISPECIES: alpha/beta hydrolase [Amphritea]MBU2964399.1 alpha/beta hydrolase [Amphritea atlantica]MDO6417727.1 alpha/beta hydrolase [Amphritea sp. 2_MG-2023]MDX2423397.1 alpha/beta hydrolase [Amphritea sp.]